MDLNRLNLLMAVARHGSMAAAAAELNYTTSAVSQQIRKLEQEAGAPLLERWPRGVRLTESGAAVVRCAEQVSARLSSLAGELDALREGRAGTVRLGVFPTFAASLLPTAILAFRQQAPGVRLIVRSSRQQPLGDLLHRREVDLAVTWSYPWTTPPTDPDQISLTHLMRDETVLILPAHHPLAELAEVSADLLLDQEWIIRADHPAGQLVERTLQPWEVLPHIAVAANDYQEMQAMVAAGLGLMLCSRLATVPLRGDLVMRSLQGGTPPVREISLCYLRGATLTPAIATMHNVLLGVDVKNVKSHRAADDPDPLAIDAQ